MLLIRVGFLAVICAAGSRSVQAQDAFLEQRPDSASALGSPSAGTTEDTNFSQGGFFGLGAQKPMKKVRGINLPEQQSKIGFSSAQQAQAQSPSAEFIQPRKFSKPDAGAPTTDFPARMVYLNGRNVSSVREQQLESVNVNIDANGNIHIMAPHYEVQESTHYRPLFAKDLPKFNKPTHSKADSGATYSKEDSAVVSPTLDTPVPPISPENSPEAE